LARDGAGRLLLPQAEALGIHAHTEVRVRIRERRFLIPDLCVVPGEKPAGRVLTVPLLSIETLSPEDQPEVAQKVREVLAFGVPYVWAIDPVTLESDLHSASGCGKLEGGILGIEGTGIGVPLDSLDED
jgi:Uma2 family endonuclease